MPLYAALQMAMVATHQTLPPYSLGHGGHSPDPPNTALAACMCALTDLPCRAAACAPLQVIKNHFASEFIYNKYKNEKTCGIVEVDSNNGIRKVAEPVGVIAGIVSTVGGGASP